MAVEQAQCSSDQYADMTYRLGVPAWWTGGTLEPAIRAPRAESCRPFLTRVQSDTNAHVTRRAARVAAG